MGRADILAHVSAHRFSRGGAFTFAIAGEEQRASARKGDFFLRPYRRQGWGWAVSDPPTVIPKAEYGSRIVGVLDGLFKLSALPLEESRRYRDPGWSMEKFGASVELRADGSVWALPLLGRGHGSFVGEGNRLEVPKEKLSTDLPFRLLEAMGERPEDIARLLK